MPKVTRVMPNFVKNTTKSIAEEKRIKRAALPVASGLAILAGSSMNTPSGPVGPHEPGASVSDSMWEQIKHTGKQAGELVADVGDSIIEGAENIVDSVLDFLDEIL